MRGWGSESQSPSEVKFGEGCEGQQKRLLQVYQQQQESYGKCMPAANWGMGPGDNAEKVKELNAFFASAFNGRICLQGIPGP